MAVRRVYMAVDIGKYELPLAVADSAVELSRITGVNINTLYTALSLNLSGKKMGMRFYKVEIEDDGE